MGPQPQVHMGSEHHCTGPGVCPRIFKEPFRHGPTLILLKASSGHPPPPQKAGDGQHGAAHLHKPDVFSFFHLSHQPGRLGVRGMAEIQGVFLEGLD